MDLIKQILSLKIKHYVCEDYYYSCPLSDDPNKESEREPVCDCGADEHNARVDRVASMLIRIIPETDPLRIPSN